jgi:hypothetical protein
MALNQYTSTTLADPNAEELAGINRQQALANALMTQGLQGQPQGQMISGYYVKPSITQALNPVAQQLAGSYLGKQADTKAQELANAIRGKQAQTVQQYMQALNPQQTELAGPTPTGAPLQTVNQPDYNAAFQAATSPYAPAPLQAAGYEMLKPQKLAEGETLNRFNFNTGQLTPYAAGGEKLPTEYKEYQKAAEGGFKGTFFDYQQALKKAGATNVSVRTGNSLAEQIGPMMKDSAAQTVGAMKTSDAANQILSALDKGNIIAGPGASVRIPAAQLATMIGAGGSNDAEKIANTRVLVQNLAKLTLAGRQQMHGEGAISNSESNIAEKAMSGNIDLTPAEIKQLADAAKRSANYQVAQHQQKLNVMRQNPETRSLAPYFEVNPMNTVEPSGNNVIDYNNLK